MATVAKIKCFSCSGTHDFYFEIRKAHRIQCPYCFTYMDEQTSDRALILMGYFADMSADLKKWAQGAGEPYFKLHLLDIEMENERMNDDENY